MPLIVYEKPTCTTCRKLAKLLREEGIDFDTAEYHVTGLTEDELRGLLQKAGITAAEALRGREPDAKALKGASEDEIIAAMVANPVLLERPIVVNGDRAVLARPVERVREVL
jgi:arsenate reductase